MESRGARNRLHIVLIPGFAGFDALGQLEYYAGITPLIQTSLSRNEVLHYFDNLPTAAVITRAARLREYLAKRIARGEIASGDEIALVGHSTGGLDIRWLLWDLHHRNDPDVIDGGVVVKPETIRKCVRRVVFLSVPHWGTNIADWVRAHTAWRVAVLAELRAAVAGSQLSILDRIETSIAGGAASLSGAGLFFAVQDSLSEANEDVGSPTPMRKAEAHEAASELALYLRDMASDFRAIDDLTSQRPAEGKAMSPAHFDENERKQELELLRDIEFLSYVTLGKRPFRFEPGRSAPVWELANPFTYPELAKDSELSKGTDIVYRTCYRACAGGPFEAPDSSAKVSRSLNAGSQEEIEVWDNDGIVNTLSMFWPKGENVLVAADHVDIVGQFRDVKAQAGSGRKYRAYDLFGSDSGLSEKVFNEVWEEILDFCRA